MGYFDLYKNRLLNNSNEKTQFKILFDNDSNKYDVLIDNTPYKVIIQSHSNPLNEYKEERKIICLCETEIKRGSIVETIQDGRKYIVTSKIDDNGIYKTAKMVEMNNYIKFKNKLGEIKQIPAYISNQLFYTPGVDQNKVMTIPDGKMNIICSYNQETEEICRNMRFIFEGKYAYEVTYIDILTQPGLMNIVLKEDDKKPNDDLVNNIADNSHLSNSQTTTQTQQTQTTNKLW